MVEGGQRRPGSHKPVLKFLEMTTSDPVMYSRVCCRLFITSQNIKGYVHLHVRVSYCRIKRGSVG
jgi:hypothetical protein